MISELYKLDLMLGNKQNHDIDLSHWIVMPL